ncbi:MAG: hypothetical protein IKO74_10060 [Selenomonadaceae bacterium]|nr:hypothetical protein [Selenomonadaceae bacterium]
MNSRELAKKFNVSRATINRITAGVTYKDIIKQTPGEADKSLMTES